MMPGSAHTCGRPSSSSIRVRVAARSLAARTTWRSRRVAMHRRWHIGVVRRALAWFARFACTLLLRRVEVADAHRLPKGRPLLLVANHFNGFVDPLVLA